MLPTKLGSFGQAVSNEKIFVGIDQLMANFGSVNKHGQHRQFVLVIGRFPTNLLLRNRLAK
jgi:hypothetical protein